MKPMRTRRFLALALLTTLGGLALITAVTAVTAVAAAAQPLADALRAQLRIEERLLERARDQYREASSLERDVLRDLRELSIGQDALLDRVVREALAGGRPAISEEGPEEGPEEGQRPAEPFLLLRLRSAERELAATRETAFALARESADRRRDLLARAARIGELRLEIAKHARVDLVDKTGLDGLWRIELAGAEITGVIDFSSEGTLVTGTYRLSDGSQGSLRGTLANNRLALERIDWVAGFDATLRGELDAAAGVIEGTWTAVDVSGGAPTSGSWTGRRISRGGTSEPE